MRRSLPRTGLPKSTVSRLTSTLVQLGYLIHREDQSRYEPSPTVLSLGYTFLANSRLRLMAAPAMREVARNTGYSPCPWRAPQTEYALRGSSAWGQGEHIGIGGWFIHTDCKYRDGARFSRRMPEMERDFVLDSIRHHSGVEWPILKTVLKSLLIDYEEKGFCVSIGNGNGQPMRWCSNS